MLVSESFGRKRKAGLHVYLMENDQDGALQKVSKIGKLSCPNMSEDIDIQGDYIYTCYESAANFYRLALDNNGGSTNAVDRIMVSSFEKTIAAIMTGDSERYTVRIMNIPIRYERQQLFSMDEDQRRRLFLRLS